MESSLKGVLLAVGTVIVCVMIGLGFYYSRESKNLSAKSSSNLSEQTSDSDDPNKLVFDGMTVTGLEIINQIDKYAVDESTIIRVIHKSGSVDLYGSAGATYCINGNGPEYCILGVTGLNYDKGQGDDQNTYLNPSDCFVGSIQRNGDGVITMITFAQVGCDKSICKTAHTAPVS